MVKSKLGFFAVKFKPILRNPFEFHKMMFNLTQKLSIPFMCFPSDTPHF